MQDFLTPFIASEKPAWLTAPDFAVMVTLVAQTAPETPKTWLSRSTIAQRSSVCERTVSSVIDKLVGQRWLKKVSGKRQYNQNLYEVLYCNLPTQGQNTKSSVSDEAKGLAHWYMQMYITKHTTYQNKKGRKCRRPLRPDWRERWPPVIQTFLDAGNTPDTVTKVFNWASANRPRQFQAGPQGLRQIWEAGLTAVRQAQ
jgi:hypothetical protein